MIRRGLQILIVGITALGAAPSHAQYVFPTQVSIQDLPDAGSNGVYILSGVPTQAEGGFNYYTFQRFQSGSTASRWATVRVHTGQQPPLWTVNIFTNEPTTSISEHRLFRMSEISSQTCPAVMTGFIRQSDGQAVSGTAFNSFESAPNPNAEFEAAFPDWEAAGVKIPLGFTFGMSVWAAFLAGTIALKWVRELSSAAT